jgi:carbamoyl-phosphate synthase large subunit
MTDPETAQSTYIEPVTPDYLEAVLRRERPDALLPTLGGQTALNTAFTVAERGVLKELGIEMLGATAEVIHRAEDREAFKDCMISAGVEIPRSGLAHTMEEAWAVVEKVGFPCIVRPAFTLGGTGGGIADEKSQFDRAAGRGLAASMVKEILIEESLVGWKEFEVEVMRDKKDNVVIVCSIENLDPMGVHTGDSITVAPIQTMTDREYQKLRDWSIRIIRAIGVETGGCNIQFAQDPMTGRMVAIEMNPRVSRSSALASKATGFPIAKIAARVAVGYTLDEISNDITRKTPASFEPAIDYCVVKIPRFAFEKFPGSEETLTIQMKSVGEVMAIGRTFKEALQKGLRSMEVGRAGLGADGKDAESSSVPVEKIEEMLSKPNRDRLYYLRHAIINGMPTERIHELSRIDPWFIENIREIVDTENSVRGRPLEAATPEELKYLKAMGFSDRQLGRMFGVTEQAFRERRFKQGVEAVYKLVDTCSAEFEAETPYYYSTYEDEDETRPGTKKKVLILGGGPNRIGQGIEFDYCCCHASAAAREMGYESIMMNCNPETVSTDYDTSDRLYFEPLTVEDVLSVVRREKPEGVIVQFGGQTPLNIARALTDAGVKILGTSVDSIELAEDRRKFSEILNSLGVRQTDGATATTLKDAAALAEKIGYPVLMRPSFVLGGAKMEVIERPDALEAYWRALENYCTKADVEISEKKPILIDKYLENATEVDVDAVADETDVFVAGVMEHIEEAGIHSGDSSCSLPPYSLSKEIIAELENTTVRLAKALKVRGLMNVQYAVKGGVVYVLEVNPRASRTVPFVSKVTGIPVARVAAKVMLGKTLKSFGLSGRPQLKHFGVKAPVFPWTRFANVDVLPGPEMKSTGEVMGIAPTFPEALLKAWVGAGLKIPATGRAFISVRAMDKDQWRPVVEQLYELGFQLAATGGTADKIRSWSIPAKFVPKVKEGSPNVLDFVKHGKVGIIINTPSSKTPDDDEIAIRRVAVSNGIPLVTTLSSAKALLTAIREARLGKPITVRSLQEFHPAERNLTAERK